MEIHYFAYGSNLCLSRLRDRVSEVESRGSAKLNRYELRWHKRSVDGSAKCSIVPSGSGSALVHGALYTMPPSAMALLDEVEGLGHGYEESNVEVQSSNGGILARTYVAAATHVDDSLRPYSWYKQLVVAGALAHGLPQEWVEALRRTAVWVDPEPKRGEYNLTSMPCGESVQPMMATGPE